MITGPGSKTNDQTSSEGERRASILKEIEIVVREFDRADIAAAACCMLVQAILDTTSSRNQAQHVLSQMYMRMDALLLDDYDYMKEKPTQ